ncbi:MAG: hypothetical protein AAGF25_04970 [Pseudomonadota bacterium]
MARFKLSALMFAFFALLAANTFFRFDIRSRPLHVLQSLIDTTMVSWLGNGLAASILVILAIGVPALTMRKKHEPKAAQTLDITKSTMKGQVYRPSRSASEPTSQPIFGKRP